MHSSMPDRYTTESPDVLNAFKIFEGEWACTIPTIGLGSANLFQDGRVYWWEQRIGGFFGKKILELGPLEGAHTHMMASRGAANITAIEANTRAYLKCLIVKNYLNFNANFVFGDFRSFLAKRLNFYDFILSCGVLYHMTDPVSLLEDMAVAAKSVGIWTHYYDEEVLTNANLISRYSGDMNVKEFKGVRVQSRTHNYGEALAHAGFSGGTAMTSEWMTRDSLLNVLQALGFSVEVGSDDPNHPNGPCILLHAYR